MFAFTRGFGRNNSGDTCTEHERKHFAQEGVIVVEASVFRLQFLHMEIVLRIHLTHEKDKWLMSLSWRLNRPTTHGIFAVI